MAYRDIFWTLDAGAVLHSHGHDGYGQIDTHHVADGVR